jgi:hypothetical protein
MIVLRTVMVNANDADFLLWLDDGRKSVCLKCFDAHTVVVEMMMATNEHDTYVKTPSNVEIMPKPMQLIAPAISGDHFLHS